MKIYLVRHGQVLHNALRMFNTDDEDLNDVGIIQAEELKEKIKDMKFDVIYSSPMKRTVHTAEIIKPNEMDIILDDRLKERSCGNLSGTTLDATNRDEYWNYNTDIKYGTSEDIKEFFERIYSFIDSLKEEDYENILVVAHSGVSKAFNGYFEGINDGKFLKRGLKNCELKEYVLEGE